MAERLTHYTTDHDTIRQWAEARGATPACVRGTGGRRGQSDIGMIRLDFPGYSGGRSLQGITWDEWFEAFDQNNLALAYQEHTADGQESNFNKIVGAETALEREVEDMDRDEAGGAGGFAGNARQSRSSSRRSSTSGRGDQGSRAGQGGRSRPTGRTGATRGRSGSSKSPGRSGSTPRSGSAGRQAGAGSKSRSGSRDRSSGSSRGGGQSRSRSGARAASRR